MGVVCEGTIVQLSWVIYVLTISLGAYLTFINLSVVSCVTFVIYAYIVTYALRGVHKKYDPFYFIVWGGE